MAASGQLREPRSEVFVPGRQLLSSIFVKYCEGRKLKVRKLRSIESCSRLALLQK